MQPLRFPIFFVVAATLTMTFTVRAAAQAPYYYGTYNPPGSGSDNSSNNSSPPPNSQPPVLYQPVPPYRGPVAVRRAPPWASPDAAALGPWPWNFDFGGGPTPVAGSNNLLTGGSNFEFGSGYNFSPRAGFVLEFMNAWLGLTDSTLQQNGATDGDASVWSITLNPVWRFRLGGPVGAYLIGGGGYYRRELRFDQPVTVFIPPFGFVSDTQITRQFDDAGGVNIGGGLTWNVGWGTKFFVEARYHYIFTPNNATQIIPITFGLRW